MGNLFQELKRRKVYNVITAYVVSSWLLLQVADTLFPAFNLPDNAIRIPALLLLLGFPIVLVLSWIFEITPEGIRKTVSATPEDTVELRNWDYLVIGVVLALIGIVAAQQYVIFNRHTDELSIDKSIAVLPFVALSSGEEDGYFADGLTEELLNLLSQLSDLKVAARTSSFYFKGKDEDIREIGSALDVAHVLEGSVRRAANRIRVTAQLIDVNTGFHLWSSNYDAQLDDIFAIQDEIATEVSSALQVQILGEESISLNYHGTDNAEAEALYMIASARLRELSRSNSIDSLANLYDPVSTGRTRELFEEITRLDPDYAEAWAGLSEVLLLLSQSGLTDSTGTNLSREEGDRLAREALLKATALAPDASSTRLAATSLMLREIRRSGADFQVLADEYDSILADDPDNLLALEQAARFHYLFGNIDRALSLLDRVLELDPLSTAMLDRANALLLWRPEEAAQQFRRIGDLYPNSDWKWGLAQIAFQTGNLHHAILWTEGAYLRNPRYEALFFALGDEDRGFELKENRATQTGGTQAQYINLDLDFWRRDYEKVLGNTVYQQGTPVGSILVHMRYSALLRMGRYEELIEYFDDEYGTTDLELHMWDGRIEMAIEVSHAMQQIGDHERAEILRTELRNTISNEPLADYLDERILRRYQSEILFFILASEGRVDEAIDQFQIMVDSGWRWLAGFSPRTIRTQWITTLRFRFEEHPIVNSVRDDPRFIELLNFVKEDNARMLAELRAGLTLEDIVDESAL